MFSRLRAGSGVAAFSAVLALCGGTPGSTGDNGSSTTSGGIPPGFAVLETRVDGFEVTFSDAAVTPSGEITGTANFKIRAIECEPSGYQVSAHADVGTGTYWWFCPAGTADVGPHLQGLTTNATVEIWAEKIEFVGLVRGESRCQFRLRDCESMSDGRLMLVDSLELLDTMDLVLEMGDTEEFTITHDFGVDSDYLDWLNTNPGDDDWEQVYRISAYLSGCTLSSGGTCGDSGSTRGFRPVLVATGSSGLSPTSTTSTTTTAPPPGAAGTWTLTIDPGPAGVCGDDDPYEETISISVTGTTVSVSGIGGSGQETWLGTFDPSNGALTFGGEKRDDGVTIASFSVVHDPSTDTLSGTESWDWIGDNGLRCEGGQSSVQGTRS